MNDLYLDIGYNSINHDGEQLCGDHVDVITANDDNNTVIVLADGLGSGVKASILSTLTAKIISTMLAEGLSITECVNTIVQTLPICKIRGVAYSTFTIMRITNHNEVELIQFDNPKALYFKKGINTEYPIKETIVDGKKILYSKIIASCDDAFIAMSDGCPHAGIGLSYNFGWSIKDITKFLESLYDTRLTAKTLSTLFIEEVNRQYGFHPGDDATCCILMLKKRNPVNIIFGPARNLEDDERMLDLFFSYKGKHIVAGGTTSTIVARYLKKDILVDFNYLVKDIPPMGKIDGVDLVTEGIITINRVLEYALDYLDKNARHDEWLKGLDGASQICRILFTEATDINFIVGRAVNPAHQNPDLPISFNIKMNLVDNLSSCLKKMGKRVNTTFF